MSEEEIEERMRMRLITTYGLHQSERERMSERMGYNAMSVL